jgi:hypothetical protein
MKVFDEKQLKGGEEIPAYKQKGLVVIETKGLSSDEERKTNVLFAFEDLCPKCENSIAGLLDKLRLDAKTKKRRARKATPRKPAEPKVEVYSEDTASTGPASADVTVTNDSEPEAKAEPKKDKPKTKGTTKAKTEAKTKTPEPEKTPEKEPEAASAASTKSGDAGGSDSEGAGDEVPEGDSGGDREDASAEAGAEPSDDRELIEDPETGDQYDAKTGELVYKREPDGKTEGKGSEGASPHPF